MKHYELANGNKLTEKLFYVILCDYNFREKKKELIGRWYVETYQIWIEEIALPKI